MCGPTEASELLPTICVAADDLSVFSVNAEARALLAGYLGHDQASIDAGAFWPARFPCQTLERDIRDGWYDAGREFSFFGGNGHPRPVRVWAEAGSLDGRPAFLLHLGPTEAGRAADDPSERRSHVNRAQSLSRTGSWDWNIASNALAWSDEIYRIFGLTPRVFDASYPAFLDRIHPDDRACVEAAVCRAIEDDADYDIEHRIVRPDGEIRFVHERAEVERAVDGSPLRMLGAVQDVTELRQLERSVTRNRDMLSGLFRISPEAIIVANAEARILVFSAGAESVFGYRAHEVVGGSIDRLMPERFRADHRHHIAAFAAGPVDSLQMGQRRPLRGLTKSGEEIPIEASLAKIRSGDEVLFTTIVRDLSERFEIEAHLIEARDQAQKASRAKSTFLANMSHEMRTPLNGIIGVASALSRMQIDPRQREMVELIESSGQALQDLLTDILDLARVEAGRLEISAETFDLEAMAEGVAALFSVSARGKGLALDLVMEDAARGGFRGDEKRIRQVLANLLSNAIKFTERGGVTLKVATCELASGRAGIRFSVSDTGIGFDSATGARLFDRFEQADGSITRRFGGSGLGLSICKALVELMGGRIWARSTPGQGAVFTFETPLEHAELNRQGVTADAVQPDPMLRRPRILLAEDHPTNRRVVELILEPLDVDLTSVENGALAVEAAAAEPYDLILMDMQMPVMGGVEAIGLIRADQQRRGLPRTPIYMLTANAMPEHRAQSMDAGADDFLTKPLGAEALIAAVAQALETPPAVEAVSMDRPAAKAPDY
jgi:PAS domain S-box-containing protein